MTQSWSQGSLPAPGVTVEVILAAVCFTVGAGAAGLVATYPGQPAALALVAGWPILALAAGVVLDQRPGSAPGRVMALLALVPVLDLAWAVARFGGPLVTLDVTRAVHELAALQVVVTAVAIPWSFRRPRHGAGARLLVALAGVGALTVLLVEAGTIRMPGTIGWLLVTVGSLGIWTLVALAARADDRTARRRTAWLLVLLGVAAAVLVGVWWTSPTEVAAYVTWSVLATGAVGLAVLWLRPGFRPLDEPLLDLLLIVGAGSAAALAGVLVRLGADAARLPSAATSAVFVALVTAAMAVPAALWARRALLTRRYGSGLLSPADVAVITADLHAQTDPRDLLERAARMVAAASGSPEARIVLGPEAPAVPPTWVMHPLVVGGDRVGTLAVDSGNTEGPEARQRYVVAQLLPTVALVARAVGLAVEAEHARRDVARERDAERRRVMGDLHDGLGPVLAGMSMRVQATLRTHPTSAHAALLQDLAAGLAASRTDLRRIVAGMTPSTLEDGDLEGALARLVASFQDVAGGPRVSLDVALEANLSPAVQVAAYRTVAEGITNALRHADATVIAVRVEARRECLHVELVDDGSGGPVVAGVGLSSLAQRATSLGGRLEVVPAAPRGTRLHVELPVGAEVAS